MAEYKQIDLQIGTEAQFESKKETLPVGTFVGITDPIHKSELDSDLQTSIDNIPNKLDKPSGNPTEDSLVKVSSTGETSYVPLNRDYMHIAEMYNQAGTIPPTYISFKSNRRTQFNATEFYNYVKAAYGSGYSGIIAYSNPANPEPSVKDEIVRLIPISDSSQTIKIVKIGDTTGMLCDCGQAAFSVIEL